MPKILIYTTPYCPYCHRAKRLLTQKGAAFEEIDVGGDWAARDALTEKAGGLTTVPQIWIDDFHVAWSWGLDPTFRLRGVKVENAPWADARPFLVAAELVARTAQGDPSG